MDDYTLLTVKWMLFVIYIDGAHFICVLGSYDHTVKLYDTRMGENVLSVNHGAPVESVLIFPTGGVFLSAGMILIFLS